MPLLLGNAKVVLDPTARDMPEASNKMRAGKLFHASLRVEGFALTAGKRARLQPSLVKALSLFSCLGRTE